VLVKLVSGSGGIPEGNRRRISWKRSHYNSTHNPSPVGGCIHNYGDHDNGNNHRVLPAPVRSYLHHRLTLKMRHVVNYPSVNPVTNHGIIAEHFHTETFNLNAYLRKSPLRARGIGGRNGPVDIQVRNTWTGQVVHNYQCKFYKTSSSTKGGIKKWLLAHGEKVPNVSFIIPQGQRMNMDDDDNDRSLPLSANSSSSSSSIRWEMCVDGVMPLTYDELMVLKNRPGRFIAHRVLPEGMGLPFPPCACSCHPVPVAVALTSCILPSFPKLITALKKRMDAANTISSMTEASWEHVSVHACPCCPLVSRKVDPLGPARMWQACALCSDTGIFRSPMKSMHGWCWRKLSYSTHCTSSWRRLCGAQEKE